jgi:hypothetical protein
MGMTQKASAKRGSGLPKKNLRKEPTNLTLLAGDSTLPTRMLPSKRIAGA